ncbi:MAG: BTAD domain-containing putative transcriptional regulator [Kiloniellales bacterium]
MAHLSLSLLGGFEIEGASAPGQRLPRKARGILAYLALNPRQKVSREKLATLFWGDSPEEQARTNLRQSLSTLRRYLACHEVEALVTEGDRVGLDLGAVDLDVARFEALCGEGTAEALAEAAGLYGSGFLDGFSLREEGFEAWARLERERLRGLAVDALSKLVRLNGDSHDLEGTMTAASRLLALDPLREDAHRALMRGYATQGRYGEALKQFELCRDGLARDLQVQPEEATRQLFRELRQQRSSAGQAERQASYSEEASPAPDQPSIIVLPFENLSSDPEQDYFAAGITENIIMGLTRFQALFVIAFKTSFKVRDEGGAGDEIGRRLGVRYVVEGSVRKGGDRIRVTAQLVDAQTGQRMWAERYDRDLGDLFAVQDEITNIVVATMAGRIEDADRRRVQGKRPEDMGIYDLVLRGRHCLNLYTQEGDMEARRHFEQALAREPDSATALAGLSVSYLHENWSGWAEAPGEALAKAFELARKAVALDEADSMARYAIANAYFYREEYELANLHIEKAVEINPNDYHTLCTKGWLMTFSGHLSEGIACSIAGKRLNPYAPDSCLMVIGIGEFMEKRYEAALTAFGEMRANDHFKLGCLAACYTLLGREREARAAAADLLEVLPDEFPGDSGQRIERWRQFWRRYFLFQNPQDREHFFSGLRQAGLAL